MLHKDRVECRLRLGEGAVGRLDVAVVRHVVPGVVLGRGVPRVDPHRVDTEVDQVGDTAPQPGDVTDTVGVAASLGCQAVSLRPGQDLASALYSEIGAGTR